MLIVLIAKPTFSLNTIISGFLGGSVKATYDENISVLALINVYDPQIIK